MIVLPELWNVGYFAFDRYAASAESLDGPTVQMASQVARERGCWVHAGSFVETRPDGRLRNTAVLLDPSGHIAHSYSKVHVFGYQSLEAELLEPGDHLDVTPTPLGHLAGLTCYDLRFPAMWSELTTGGAETVVVPACWPRERLTHWQLLTTARAVDNQVFVIACNATGQHGGITAGGHSRIVDPWGRLVAEATSEEDAVLIADIDPALVPAIRTEFPVLKDRLDDYSALTR